MVIWITDVCVTIVWLFFSAIIEHTNQVIFLEDDDVAAVSKGNLTIHRIKRNEHDPNERTERDVITLKMEIQEIMKGGLPGLILGLHPANERRRYFVTPSLIGWVQA